MATNGVLILTEQGDSVRIGRVRFPKRAGWDYDGSFTAKVGRRRMIFVLRDQVIASGYLGHNYRRGICWTGRGYMDINFFLDTNDFRTNDEVFDGGGYEDPLSPITYVEKWERLDLERPKK